MIKLKGKMKSHNQKREKKKKREDQM